MPGPDFLRLAVFLATALAFVAFFLAGFFLPEDLDELLDDVTVDHFFRDSAFTNYHPTGTAKMGPHFDTLAVVDDRLVRVHGVAGLRVVDANIMPVIVRGHPQAAVVAIAKKASEMILADATVGYASDGTNETNSGAVHRVIPLSYIYIRPSADEKPPAAPKAARGPLNGSRDRCPRNRYSIAGCMIAASDVESTSPT